MTLVPPGWTSSYARLEIRVVGVACGINSRGQTVEKFAFASCLLFRFRIGKPLLGHEDRQQNSNAEDAGQKIEDGKEGV